ncbi:MAG: EAL domain-containing protein [Desulfuromonadales bacterium]|nr:EAL domain-containing protein [Desulfuromonadales bacterium]
MDAERFKYFLDIISEGFWDWDLKAERGYLSPRYCELTDCASDENVFSSEFLKKYVHPDDYNHILHVFQERLQGKLDVSVIEYRVLLKDGTVRWIEDRGKIVEYDDQGLPSRMVGAIIDITERKQSESLLKQSEENFRVAFEGASDAIFWADAVTGTLINCNMAAEKMLEYSREEIIGKHQTWLHPPEMEEYFEQQFKRTVVLHDQIDHAEAIVVSKSGRKIPVHIKHSITKLGDRDVMQGLFRDVSEQKQAEKSLLQSFNLLNDLSHQVPGVLFQTLVFRDGTICTPYSSDKLQELYEVTPDQIRSDISAIVERFHPDDRERTLASFYNATEKINKWECEFRVLLPRQGLKWLYGVALPQQRQDGTVHFYGFIIDITERKQKEDKQREINSLQDILLESIDAGVVIIDAHTHIIEQVNNKCLELFEGTEDQIIGSVCHYLLCPAEKGSCPVTDHGQDVDSSDRILLRADGSRLPILKSVRHIRIDGKDKLLETLIDITERKRAEEMIREQEARLRAVVDNLPFEFWAYDWEKRIIMQNPACISNWGNMLGKLLADLDVPDAVRKRWNESLGRAKTGEIVQEEVLYDANGSERFCFEIAAPVSDIGTCWGAALVSVDITSLKKAEAEIQRLAYHDPLTGLPNRLLLNDRLTSVLADAKRYGHGAAVLFIDLDNFKVINDSLGHAIGDLLLCEVGKHLEAGIRKSDTIARTGGDEFVVVLEDIVTPAAAAFVAQNLLQDLATPFSIKGQQLFVSASIGIALYPDDGTDTDTLLKSADAAMYDAKEAGKNIYHFYTAEINLRVEERLRLENELRQALIRNEFFLRYQPIWNVTTGEICGMEALLRWLHPQWGELQPNTFIPIAEETGLIIPIGEWVLRTAFQMLEDLQAVEEAHLRISINISGRQLRDHNLADHIAALLLKSRINPASIELEITESSLMHNVDEAVSVLSALKKMGVSLAIDDFGKGYSSLYYLKRFPLDRLKIDKSFIRDVAMNEDDAAIVRATIALAQSLKLEVTAEGIETVAQKEFIQEHGCNEMQGFLFSRPVMEKLIFELLRSCAQK